MATNIQRTTTALGNRRIFTYSAWIKMSLITSGEQFLIASNNEDSGGSAYSRVHFKDNKLTFSNYDASLINEVKTSRVFRDTSAWYHIVVAIDTTQGTASDRVKMYVNGVQETSMETSSYPAQNYDTFFNYNSGSNYKVHIGTQTSNMANYFLGSMSHIHFIDGTAYQASDFGESDANGVWKPKTAPSVTYGTNGFFLKFENSGSMGTDSSGNANNFTVSSGTLTQTLDTPSNVYCTLNSLDNYFYNATFSNGNTTVVTPSTGFTYGTTTMGVGKGKWYIESKYISNSGGDYTRFGITYKPSTGTTDNLGGTGQAVYRPDGSIVVNGTETASWGSSWTTSDIISIALDCDNSKLYFAKNGVWQNSADPSAGTGGISITDVTTLSTGNYFFGLSDNNNGGSATWSYNFGNGYFGTTAVSSAGSNGNGAIFEYDVPTGYYALNTKNLATYG